MTQPLPDIPWVVDPDDPRAPPQHLWDAMSAAQRQAVIEALPSEFPVSEASPPEGDFHDEEGSRLKRGLRRHYDDDPRGVYIGGNLPVYYPGEPMFSPDLIAVVNVKPHLRDGWVASAEGKGLDFALELIWSGRRRKDLVDNVFKYARLGIPEYFVFDMPRRLLLGYRLPAGEREYSPIAMQAGMLEARSLGLRLMVEGEKLRFLMRNSPILDPDELIVRLESTVQQETTRVYELELALEAEQKAREAEQKAREAEQKAREAEQKAREAEQKAREKAEAKLRELGFDPKDL